jgi:hypothetical protein
MTESDGFLYAQSHMVKNHPENAVYTDTTHTHIWKLDLIKY